MMARRARNKIPSEWLKRFRLIPGYDPVRTALPGQYFDVAAAEHVCGFFPACLHHVKGPAAGQPFHLAEWEKAWVGCLFGWKNPDGKRRYRTAFVYVPKKNNKTTLTAGLVLYGLTQDGEMGAEIYSGAASKEQAGIIFNTIVGMRRLDDDLKAALTVYGEKGGSQQRSVIYTDPSGVQSVYRPLASDEDTADGLNVHMAVVDELHRHKSGALLDILVRGTAVRSQPLVVIITTAAAAGDNACNRERERAIRVRDNGGDPDKPGFDPTYLPVIFEASEKDDPGDPKVWAKANPGLGISKPLAYMEQEYRKAKDDPVAMNLFRRLDLNIITQDVESLFDLTHWDRCPAVLREPKELIGRRCWGALDLSQSNDLTSLAWVFEPTEPDGVWDVLWRFWCCEEAARKRQQAKASETPYEVWAQNGWIEIHDGSALDYPKIKERIVEESAMFGAGGVAYDPYNASDICRDLLNSFGVPMVEFRQGLVSLNDPTKRTKELIAAHKINHGGNPVARWCVGNAVGKPDDKGNVYPIKGKSKDKIDGAMVLVMGVGMSMRADHPVDADQLIVAL